VILKQLKGLKLTKGFVVCWEHNWPECEDYAEVIDLRAIVEQGPRIWLQSTLPEYQSEMDLLPHHAVASRTWTVSPRAKKGDLIMMWRAGSKTAARNWDVPLEQLQSFTNVIEVASAPVKKRDGFIRSAAVRRIANLENPLRWGAIRVDPVLRNAPFVRAQMQGQWDVTPYWWRLYSMLVQLNPSLKTNRRFNAFDPKRLW
jgi:hypothetical protein